MHAATHILHEKTHACGVLKRHNFRVHVSLGSAETLGRRGGIINHHSIAYSLSNISAKNYQNRLMWAESIVCNISVVFFRHNVYNVSNERMYSARKFFGRSIRALQWAMKWAVVSSSSWHRGQMESWRRPIMWSCWLRPACPVSRPTRILKSFLGRFRAKQARERSNSWSIAASSCRWAYCTPTEHTPNLLDSRRAFAVAFPTVWNALSSNCSYFQVTLSKNPLMQGSLTWHYQYLYIVGPNNAYR